MKPKRETHQFSYSQWIHGKYRKPVPEWIKTEKFYINRVDPLAKYKSNA